MNMREFAEHALMQARKTKQHMLTEHGQLDMMPVISLGYRGVDGLDHDTSPPPEILERALSVNDDDFARAVGGIIAHVSTWDSFDRWVGIAVISDSRICKDPSVLDDYSSLDQAFKWGDDRVTEALIIVERRDDLVGGFEEHTAVMEYKLDDGGIFVFDDVDHCTEPGSGRVLDAMREAMNYVAD